jgi:hypothetical protein
MLLLMHAPTKQSITGATWAELKSKADRQGQITLKELLPYWNKAMRTSYEAGQQTGKIDGRIDQLLEIQEMLKRGVRLAI